MKEIKFPTKCMVGSSTRNETVKSKFQAHYNGTIYESACLDNDTSRVQNEKTNCSQSLRTRGDFCVHPIRALHFWITKPRFKILKNVFQRGAELRHLVFILRLLFYLPHHLRNLDLFVAIKMHYPVIMAMNSPYQSKIS